MEKTKQYLIYVNEEYGNTCTVKEIVGSVFKISLQNMLVTTIK